MGVPAFFRWLSRKYPSIVVHATEERARQLEDGTEVPVDSSLPNPNGVEFDNLYLDMNGIIHPCCHPEDRPAPTNEEEMMVLIFEYIDRIFRTVRPRRLLYMAIDGVAPRAKMNQQRSRRFRSSKEAADKEEEIRRAKQKLIDEGLQLPDPPKTPKEKFDSNVITPGTEFMANLAENLRYYIHDRLTNDPAWANISVILSDANVPGEGEHKIMDFIRKQRSNPNHDPNTHHCLCGADADLIMLGLATHEPNFTIIREEFKPNAPRPCELCGQPGHEMQSCRGKTQQLEADEEPPPPAPAVEFIFLRLCVLREYLEKELQPDRPLSYKFDLERAIDDWVFMCFFVGNDFLPHLPSLEIRENAIDRLIDLYKRNSDRSGGYLTENGFVNLQRAQTILYELGKMEDGILRNRMFKNKSDRRRDKERERQKRKRDEEFGSPPTKRRSGNDDYRAPAYHLTGAFAAVAVGRNIPDEYAGTPMAASRQAIHDVRVQATQFLATGGDNANLSSAQKLRAMLIAPQDEAPKIVTVPGGPLNDNRNGNGGHNGGSSRNDRQLDDDEDDPNDIVRLGEEGWKERYYMNKFGVSIGEDARFQRELVKSYVEGLCWVLQYYYQGCPSWTWYYPYHYSPFASDFVEIGNLNIVFPKNTQPFKPLEQLMGVFPAASGTFLPQKWRKLMTDADSPILDFYPTDFCVDLNGKKFAWQGVALLPFVDEDRLLNALAEVYDTLTPEEQARNTRGHNLLFLANKHKSFTFLLDKFYKVDLEMEETVVIQSVAIEFHPMSPPLIYGMAGLVSKDVSCHCPNRAIEAPYASLPTIHINKALSVLYRDPEYPADHKYPATKLPGAKAPLKVLGDGRAQTGFDPNRPRMSLDAAGHRMLNGAVGGGRGGGGRGGGSFYDRQRPHDDRRGYNEERYYDDRGYQGYQGGGNYRDGNQDGYQGQRHSYGGYTGGSSGPSYGRNNDGYQRPSYQPYPASYNQPRFPSYDGRGSQYTRYPAPRDDRQLRPNDRPNSGGPARYYTPNYRRPN